jgi:hypothetical protein
MQKDPYFEPPLAMVGALVLAKSCVHQVRRAVDASMSENRNGWASRPSDSAKAVVVFAEIPGFAEILTLEL